MNQSSHIFLRGVSTNNLKKLDVAFPLYQLTSVTGVSGSGKSSLVFDTLYAEAYRRYVESLSSFARQYMKALPKPAIDSVDNLPPSIAVQQSRSGANNRSTVGTLTEIHDLLRVIFSQLGVPVCQTCKKVVEKANPDRIAVDIVSSLSGQKVLIATPIDSWNSLSDKDLRVFLQTQGFNRLWINSKLERLEDMKKIPRVETWVVIDRISVGSESQKRIAEAASLGLKLGRGRFSILGPSGQIINYSNLLECCGQTYVEPSMALFSFNHPVGACSNCQGFGSSTILDPDKIIPDSSQSLQSKGVTCWNFGDHDVCYQDAQKSALNKKLDIRKKPFSQYSDSEKQWLWDGDGKNYSGIVGYFAWLDSKRYKTHYRIHAARFRKYITCPDCCGLRLNWRSRAVEVAGFAITEVEQMAVSKLVNWISQIRKSSYSPIVGRETLGQSVDEALLEASARLNYLQKMGLSYLSLNRSAKTLSGGELQRINMSRCLGSVLTDTLFCLDEPTSGLHARDSLNLLSVIRELRDQGNTVVVVEHDRTVIEGSDYFIEIGPEAGHRGGQLVYSGAPRACNSPANVKNQGLEHRPEAKGKKFKFFQLDGANTHNLKDVSIRIPLGKLSGICGVSGSGKTSLITHTLFPLLVKFYEGEQSKDNFSHEGVEIGPSDLLREFSGVMMVSQVALGRSSRSTIATYLDIMDHVRKLFANQDLAKRLGLTPGAFSFNSPGGRCETCRGLGSVVEDLSFLGEMDVICPACQGKRFQEKVLEVTYNGKNLIDVLSLTVEEARSFFIDSRQICASLDAVLKVGMGYVTLGQSTSSFSGGEAQRLKLVQIMREAYQGKPRILIFDEPTTGLSDRDVQSLLLQLKILSELGHTVIVIEHHIDFLKNVDWLIEVGPEAAEQGGTIVFEGIPTDIVEALSSRTRPFFISGTASL